VSEGKGVSWWLAAVVRGGRRATTESALRPKRKSSIEQLVAKFQVSGGEFRSASPRRQAISPSITSSMNYHPCLRRFEPPRLIFNFKQPTFCGMNRFDRFPRQPQAQQDNYSDVLLFCSIGVYGQSFVGPGENFISPKIFPFYFIFVYLEILDFVRCKRLPGKISN